MLGAVARTDKSKAINDAAVVEAYLREGTVAGAARALGLDRATVRKRVRAAGHAPGRGSPRRYALDEAFFSTYTRESCYWAGFIAADGSLVLSRKAHRVQIPQKACERPHLEAFLRCAGSTHPIEELSPGGYDQVRVTVSCREWWGGLCDLFALEQRKSFTLRPPPEAMPEEMRWHYTRGYFDGDGGFQAKGGCQLAVYSGSRVFLQWVVRLFRGGKIHPHRTIWRALVSGDHLHAVLTDLYRDSTPDTRLARKYEQAKEMMV